MPKVDLPLIQPDCYKCGLENAGARLVKGYGKPGGIVVVGEAPGQDEMAKKIPFIGASGRLLKAVFKEAGIDPDSCYYTNVCLCRPPNNRTPTTSEAGCCSTRLRREILDQKPTRILCLGSTASEAFLGQSIGKCYNRYGVWEGIPTIATYHPAHVFRMPDAFRDMAQGIQKLLKDPCTYYTGENAAVPYQVITSVLDALAYFKWLEENEEPPVIDIETQNPSLDCRFLCIGFSVDPNFSTIIPASTFSDPIVSRAFEALTQKIGCKVHNGSFEWPQLFHRFGIDIHITFDSMLAHYALDERSGGGDDATEGTTAVGGSYHKLKTLGGVYFDAPDWSDAMKPYHEDFGSAPTEILYKYLSLDLSVTHRICTLLEEELYEEDVHRPVKEVLFPAIKTLGRIELVGVSVDVEYFKELAAAWKEEIKTDEAKFNELAGKTVNINSYKQLGALLFDDWKLKKIDGRSTNKKTVMPKLLRLYPDNEALKMIVAIRSKKHILATYIVGIPKLLRNGRIHTRFLLHGSDTGRLASRHPNLQNIPARIGSVIRDGFITTPGWDLAQFDYKQLEFKVWAYYSQDARLIGYINSGRDIHSEIACFYFNCEPHQVTKSQRLDAKAVVFGLLYGRGVKSIAEEYGLAMSEAERRFAILQEMFPDGISWTQDVRAMAKSKGFVQSGFGRKRRFPFLTNRNSDEIERQAVNSPIQSLASDICLLSAGRILQQADSSIVRPLLLVHDSVLVEVREGYMAETIPWLTEEMEKDPFPTPVRFTVDVEVGKRWGSLTKSKVVNGKVLILPKANEELDLWIPYGETDAA